MGLGELALAFLGKFLGELRGEGACDEKIRAFEIVSRGVGL